MENTPSKSDLPDLLTHLSEVPEVQMPTNNIAYGVVTIVCTLIAAAVIGVMTFLQLGIEPKIQATFIVIVCGFIYSLVKLKPNTEEATVLLGHAKDAIKVSANFDVRIVRMQYSKTTYFNFTIENKELRYKTKLTACNLTYEARELLESHLEGADVIVSNISREVQLLDIDLITNPNSKSKKPLVLLIWRGHLIWCRADKEFALEAIQFKKQNKSLDNQASEIKRPE